MAIHELTTNAVKYGALSVPEGRVDVQWRVERDDGGEVLHLGWTEHNGPAVTEPTRQGFGMTMIRRGLRQDMSADVDIDFAPDGVSANITARLGATMDPKAGPRMGPGLIDESQARTAAYGLEDF
jgi:two-component sensor histidine kinase